MAEWCRPRQVTAGCFGGGGGGGGDRVVQVACGEKHVLALTEDGNVLSWGDSSYGQCGVKLPAAAAAHPATAGSGGGGGGYGEDFEDDEVEDDDSEEEEEPPPDPAVRWAPAPIEALLPSPSPKGLNRILGAASAGSRRHREFGPKRGEPDRVVQVGSMANSCTLHGESSPQL